MAVQGLTFLAAQTNLLRPHLFVSFVDNYLNVQNKFSAYLNSYDLGEFRVLNPLLSLPHSFNWALVFFFTHFH
jgi:hypothetical protein